MTTKKPNLQAKLQCCANNWRSCERSERELVDTFADVFIFNHTGDLNLQRDYIDLYEDYKQETEGI